MGKYVTAEDELAWRRWWAALPDELGTTAPEGPARQVDVLLRYRVDRFGVDRDDVIPTSFLIGATPAEHSVSVQPECPLPVSLSSLQDFTVSGQRVDLTRRGQVVLEHVRELWGLARLHIWYSVSEDWDSTGA